MPPRAMTYPITDLWVVVMALWEVVSVMSEEIWLSKIAAVDR